MGRRQAVGETSVVKQNHMAVPKPGRIVKTNIILPQGKTAAKRLRQKAALCKPKKSVAVVKKNPLKKQPAPSKQPPVMNVDERARRSVTVLYKIARSSYRKKINKKQLKRLLGNKKAIRGKKPIKKIVEKKNVKKMCKCNQSVKPAVAKNLSSRTRRAVYIAKVKRFNARMVKKDSSKPRGKMSAYAFFLQVYREELKQRNPNESVNFAEFSKKCAEKWKGMNELQKKRFNDMAAQDKNRHAQEMEHYQPAPGERGGKRKRGKKDPNAPKRALSAFFWFCNEERPNVKASLQNSNSVALVAKELGRRWALVRPEHKSRYEALAAKDKERYEKEQKVYKARAGVAGPAAKKPAVAPRVGAAPLQQAASDDDDEDDDEDDEDDDE